ncbi:MAG TPA: UDP-N-acetylmuramoyl-tripeptide--D-alanyl-D-alanine ligase [Acetobacteraceae bacterium]|jgi:UDP-N-acetylmuramoyl-tripeptide--D-alanyl-D-alanine ligase|nr:UDP-N-acetylmuramoyl-tripeptide--D-alanyl-D-alanine ligase [Acetobacteraceae bacterium]
MKALWTAADLQAATGGNLARAFECTGVSIDSRAIGKGELFVALIDRRDGHDFVSDALVRGAAAGLVSRRPDNVPADAPLLTVPDTLAGLHALGRFGRARFGGRVAAVTGSVGKTTTKEMLRTVLGAFGPTHASAASYNNQWGVPLTLARMPPGDAFAVIEIGMNMPGEIAPLARLAAPRVTLITAIEKAHLGHLGSLCAIADEKAAIMEGLVAGGVAVLPADTPALSRLERGAGGRETRLFGERANAWARLITATADADGTDVVADVDGARVSFRLAAPGRHMAMNAVGALAVAATLGLDVTRAAAALAGFAPMAGRGARRCIRTRGGKALLLDESYNASAAAVRAALGVLELQAGRRKIAVLGDMLELGEHGASEHAGLAPAVLAGADLLFTCGSLMETLFRAIPPARRGAHAADSAALAPIVAEAVRPGDAVLVKGSLGSRMKLVVDALEHTDH